MILPLSCALSPLGRARSRVQAFTPADLPGVPWWGRATHVTADETGLVSAWPDMRGGAYPTATATGTKRPLRVENAVNGKPGLVFDSVDDVMVFDVPMTTAQIYCVIRSTGPTWNTFAGVLEVQDGNPPYSNRVGFFQGGDTTMCYDPYPRGAAKNGVDLELPFDLAPIDQWFVLRIDANNPSLSRLLSIGTIGNLTALAFSVAEIVPVEADLSAANDLKLRQYFQAQYAVGV